MIAVKFARTGPARLLLATLAMLGTSFWPPSAPAQVPPTTATAAEPNDPRAAARGAELAEPNTATPTAPVEDPNATATPLAVADAGQLPANVSIKALEAQKKQVAASQDLGDELKSKLTEVYDKAIAQLKLVDELKTRRAQYSEALKSAPEKLESVRQSLEKPASAATPDVPADLTPAQAEQRLTQATSALEEAKTAAANLENEPKKRAERRTKIPEESGAARQRLEEIEASLAAPVADASSALSQANRTLWQLEQHVVQSRIEANNEEVLYYDATSDLLAAQRDLAARQLASAQKRVEFWQQKVGEMRQQAAEAATEEADRVRKQTRSAHPIIQQATEYNAELAQKQAKLVEDIEAISRYSADIDSQLASVQKDLSEMQDQVAKAGGVTDVLGVRLLGKRSKLPNTSDNRRRIRNRPAKIAQAQFDWIEYDSRWLELSDIEQRANTLVEQAKPPLAEAERETVQKELIEHLRAGRQTLKALSDLCLDYSSRLANLDTRERGLVAAVTAVDDFIDAHVLWVKSRHTVRPSDARHVAGAVRWLLSPASWRAAVGAVGSDIAGDPLPYLLTVLAAVAAVVFHSRIHGQIDSISEQVRQLQTDGFLPTVRAMALTALLAATWPVILWLSYWCLSSAGADNDFVQAGAAALPKLAYLVLVLSFVRHMVMPRGVAEEHFRLRKESVAFLRRHLRWFAALVVPIVFVLEVLHAQQYNDQWYATVGRLLFIVALLVLAALLLLLFRPSSPLIERYLRQHRDGWLDRLRYLWYPLCCLLPIALALLAGAGYFYGARYLSDKLVDTVVLALLVLLLRATFIRWLAVAQRRLAMFERERRQAAEVEPGAAENPASASARPAETTETGAKPEQTLFQMSQQTRHLINVVTAVLLLVAWWYLWNDVLPAFATLGKHELWRTGSQEVITLGAVATAVLVVILTGVAARNAPGLLEIVILRRLPIDRGARFAIITIGRYILVTVGVVIAFGRIGIGWSKVQWLVAAMTVGLGFGLQEIFANFISGLIILFEQPVRVDDVVTVGDVTGRVAKIKIRATTIRKWDQRELIVPNKEFITGRLINWTLSDSLLRMIFPVGIAYGSDIRKAERVLYEIAEAEPKVLGDPKPVVIFTGFGASSLDFELRVYFTGMDTYLPLWHDVNCAIDDAFRKADIEIAFPQHDLHLRSADPDIRNLFRMPPS